MANFITKDGAGTDREFDFDGLGSTANPFIPRSRALLGATNETAPATPTDPSGLNGLLRAFWGGFVTNFGTTADAASSTGSLMARIRQLLVDTVGATADAASATGSLMARLRQIANSYAGDQNVYSARGTTTAAAVSATPATITGHMVHNRNAAIRWFQLFDRTTTPTAGTVPRVSIPILASGISVLSAVNYGSAGGLDFSTGLAWGMSTTEGTYTAATASETSVMIYWRSL